VAQPTVRNVLFITADQWRGEALGAVGHPCIKTPNLDRLAADGVLFPKHYSQATPCSPGRASLLTGLYMFNHRVVYNGVPLERRFTNLALEARQAGYDPVLFGYTSTAPDPTTLDPADPRLETYEGVLPGFKQIVNHTTSWLAWLNGRGYEGLSKPADAYKQVPDYPGAEKRGYNYSPPAYGADESDTAFAAGEALNWLAVNGGRRPWFAHLSFKRPHPPWVAPEPYNAMYDPADVPVPSRAASPDEEAAQHPFLAQMIENHRRKRYLLNHNGREADIDDFTILQARATYYGLMSEVDHHIGRIIDYLKKSGQYDDTLIVFTSDHAEHLGDHHLQGKSGYFDQAYHIPLIIRDPDGTANGARGGVIDAFTENVDIMPTILDWLGREVPVQCDGATLMPFVQGETPDNWRTEAHWEFDWRHVPELCGDDGLGLAPDQCHLAAIRDDAYKYVHFPALEPLLFDLRKDPDQLVNRAGDPAYADIQLEYTRKMLSWRMTHAERIFTNTFLDTGGVREWRGPRY
jgi:arylsulfatase A-like enzyme